MGRAGTFIGVAKVPHGGDPLGYGEQMNKNVVNEAFLAVDL